jgi:hypothetical protein
MPIPKPRGGETEQDYVSRCIEAIYDEYGQEQSAAICYSTWREGKMNKSTTNRVADKINKLSNNYKGINLSADGEVNMEEPCWAGYRQYGTKMLDNREVPNCVPISE